MSILTIRCRWTGIRRLKSRFLLVVLLLVLLCDGCSCISSSLSEGLQLTNAVDAKDQKIPSYVRTRILLFGNKGGGGKGSTQCDICGRGEDLVSPDVNIWISMYEKGHESLAETVLLQLPSDEEQATASTAEDDTIVITCRDLDEYLIVAGRDDDNICDLQYEYRDVCSCGRHGGGGGGNGENSGSNTTSTGGGSKRGKKGDDSNRAYMKADTQTKKAFIAWLPRISALMSAIGSTLILRDVFFTRRKKQRKNQRRRRTSTRLRNGNDNSSLGMYHQLVAGMSIFDIIGSIAWGLSTLPQPYRYENDELSYIYGAMGNYTTCKMQGFMLQLGLAATNYFVSLTAYYLLSIRYRFTESRLQKYKWLFHVPPVAVGLVLAVSALPYYRELFLVCHIPPPYIGGELNAILLLCILPIVIAIVVSMVSMCFTYTHVRQTDAASSRWRLGGSHNAAARTNPSTGRMTNAVFWQFTLYVASFMMTWPIYFAAMLVVTRYNMAPYSYWVILAILTPLQGCWNAIVYFRPMIAHNLEQKRLKKQREQDQISPQDGLQNNHCTSIGDNNKDIQKDYELSKAIPQEQQKEEKNGQVEEVDLDEATYTSTAVFDSLGSSAMYSLTTKNVSFQQLPDALEDGMAIKQPSSKGGQLTPVSRVVDGKADDTLDHVELNHVNEKPSETTRSSEVPKGQS